MMVERARLTGFLAAQFIEIKAERKPSLFALVREADYARSMRILEMHDLRQLAFSEAEEYRGALGMELRGKPFFIGSMFPNYDSRTLFATRVDPLGGLFKKSDSSELLAQAVVGIKRD